MVMNVKLGKKPARNDPRTLRLAKYFTPELPLPPSSCDYTMGITDFGMMLNDTLSDCTIAACGHAEQVWSAARGAEYTVNDAVILERYEQWCGYVSGDPSTDQGGFEVDVLNAWRKHGFTKPPKRKKHGRRRHRLLAYADPDPANLTHVMQAIDLFGGVYIGVQLPLSVQDALVWDVSRGPNAYPGSWGGHAVFVPKYRTEKGKIIFTCISWGMPIDITEAFWLYSGHWGEPYIDEVHALVAPEFLNLKTGQTPGGLNLAQMEDDVLLVTS